VVLYDLEQFHEYFNGLVVPYPPGIGEEAMNDPEEFIVVNRNGPCLPTIIITYRKCLLNEKTKK